MTRYAHINVDQITGWYPREKSWVVWSDGTRTAPITPGMSNGNERVVPVETVEIDNSTGPDVVVEDSGWVVEADRVVKTYTKRDMTAQEITDRDEGEKDSAEVDLDNERALKALAAAVWHVHNGSVPASVNTPTKFRQWLRTLM